MLKTQKCSSFVYRVRFTAW